MTNTMLNEGEAFSRGAMGRKRSPNFSLPIDDAQAAQLMADLGDQPSMLDETRLDLLEGYTGQVRSQKARDMRGMYTDPVAWWKSEGNDNVADEVKHEIANRRFIANAFGQTTDEQGDLYPSFRDQYFDQTFGKVPVNESEAFTMLQQGVTAQQQTEQAISELPATLALNLMRAAAGGTEVSEAASYDIYQAWKDRHADALASLPEDWESRAMEQAESLRVEMDTMMRDIAPEAKKVWDILQKFTRPEKTYTGDEPPQAQGRRNRPSQRDTQVDDDTPVSREDIEGVAKALSQMPEDKQQRLLEMLYMSAEATGAGMGRGFFEKVGEGLVRGGVRIYEEGVMASEDRTARYNLTRLKRGETLYEMADGVVGTQEEIARLASSGNYNATKLLADPSFQAGTGNVNDQRRGELLDANEQRLRELSTLRKIRNLASSGIDPLKTEMTGIAGSVMQGAYDYSQSAAYTVMAGVPFVGFPAVAISLANTNYLRMLDEYPDIDPDFAWNLSLAIGAPQAFVERFKVNALMGRSPMLNKLMKRMTDARVPLGARIAIGYGANVAYQTGQEFVQEAMPTMADQLAAAIREDMPEFEASQAWGAYVDEMPQIFFSMLWAGLIGTGAVSLREFKRDGIFLTNVGELEMVGIVGDTARDIAAEQDTDARNEKIKTAWGQRSESDIKAGIAKRAAMLQAANVTDTRAGMPQRDSVELKDGTVEHTIRDSEGNVLLKTTDSLAADVAYIGMVRQITSKEFNNDRDVVRDLVQQWEQADPNNVVQITEPMTAEQKLAELEQAGNTEQIAVLHRRIAQSGLADTPLDQINILGEATVQDVGDMVFRGVIALNANSRPQDAREEMHHVAVRRAVARGDASLDQLRSWLADTENILEQTFPRETLDDIVESIAVVQRAFEDGQINAAQETGLPPSFVDYIKRMITAFAEVLKRAVALRQAFQSGALSSDYEAFLAQTTGADQQSMVDAARDRTSREMNEAQNYSIVRSVDYLKNDTRFDDLVKDGRVVTGVDVNDFIDQHILLHSPDNAFAGTIQLTDGEQIDGKGGVYYPVLYADKNYFWASTAAMVTRTATHLNEVAAKNGGRVLMGLVSAPVEKLFSSTSMSTGAVKFLNALTTDSRAGLRKSDLNAMLVAASKVEVIVATKTKTTKKTFATKLKASDSYATNLAKIDGLLEPTGSIFQVRKAFVESLADQVAKHLNATPASAEYVAGILADAENKHAKNTIKRGKLSKASVLQGLGNLLTEPFLRDFQEHGNGKIYAIVEVQGEVKGIATTEHESYPATVVPVNNKSKVKLHVLKEAVDWQDVVGKETGQYSTPQERLNLLPTSGMSATSLKVLGVKVGSKANLLNYSIASKNSLRVRMTRQAMTDAALAQSSWKDWYEEHQAVLDEFFGEYAQLFQDILSITSQAASVKANVGLALRAFGLYVRGEPFDGMLRGQEKRGFLPAVIKNLERHREREQLQGQKIRAYKASNDGEVDQAVVDRHIAQLIFGVKSPSKAQFAKAQRILSEIANEIGWTPRQVQAALWAHSIYKSGKTPQSYGDYLKQLESRGTIEQRIGDLGRRGPSGDADGGGRGRFAPDGADGPTVANYSILARYEGMPSVVVEGGRPYSPIVRDLLQRRAAGENIPREVIDQAINENFPAQLVEVPRSVADLPDRATIDDAIDKGQRDKRIDVSTIEVGEKVSIRQDVPSMTRKGVGVVTVKSKSGNSYEAAVRITGPVFVPNEKASLRIAMGESKKPHIVINGAWAADQTMPTNLETWTQVGYNPDRHSFYYDRATMQQVTGGSEAYQIGNTVFVQGAQYGDGQISDISYSISTQSEIDRVTAAMDKLTRGPDARTEIYHRAKDRMRSVLGDNWDILRSMEGTASPQDIRRTQILQTFGVLDAVLKELPTEVRGKIGFTDLAKINPVDVLKDGQKISESNTARGGMTSAWMREGMNIGQAQKQTTMPQGYSVRENLDTARADKAIVEALRRKFDQIDRALERSLRDDYREKIEKLLKSATPQKDERRILKGRLTPEIAALVERADALREMDTGEVADKMQELYSRLDAEKDPDALATLTDELTLLQLFGDFNKLDSMVLSDTHAFLSALINTGRDIRRVLDEDRSARMQAMRDVAVKEFSGGQGILAQPAAVSRGDKRRTKKIREGVYQFHLKNQSFEWLLNAATRPDKTVGTLAGKITQAFSRMAHRATHQERRRRTDGERAAYEKMAEIFGVKVGMPLVNALYKFKSEVNYSSGVSIDFGRRTEQARVPVEVAQRAVAGEGNLGFNKDELKALRELLASNAALPQRNVKSTLTLERVLNPGTPTELALSQDTALYYYMLSKQDGPRENLELYGWSEGSFAALEKFLQPQTRAIEAWLSKEYYDTYFEINAVYREIHHVNLSQVINYSPVQYEVDAKLEENLMDNDHMMSSTSPSFVRGRVRHRSEVRERGALDMYFRHLVDAGHYISWALPMRDMRSVLGHKDVQRVLNQQQGSVLPMLLNDKLDQFASGGRKAAFTMPLLDAIRSSFVIAKQSFNWGVMLKQLTSFPAYMYDVPFKEFFKYEAEFWMNPLANTRKIASIPFVKQRFGEGFDRDMLRVTKQFERLDKPRTRLAGAAEYGMIAVKFGDIVPVITGGYAAYRYKYEQVLAETGDAVQAERDAVEYFEMVTERAQQAGDVKDLSFYQSGGSVARMLSMFKTAPRQYYSNVYESMLDWKAGKEGAGSEFARRLFIGQVVLPIFFQIAGDLVRNTFREPDERELDPLDYLRAIAVGPLNGLFVFGGILEAASYWFVKGRWFDSNQLTGLAELPRLYRSIGRVGTAIRDGEINGEDTLRTLDETAIALSSMMGGGYVWYDIGRRLTRSVGLDDESEELTGDFLDWAEEKVTE